MNVSKNISIGEPISDLRELIRLSKERKSVIIEIGGAFRVRPAAWVANMSVAMLTNMPLFYSIKTKI